MPIYDFQPIDLNHPDWAASSHTGRCRAHAEDELAARMALHLEFSKAAEYSNKYKEMPKSPWPHSARVECIGTLNEPPPEYQEGLIEVYAGSGEDGQWIPINEDRLPVSDTKSQGGGYAAQTLPSPNELLRQAKEAMKSADHIRTPETASLQIETHPPKVTISPPPVTREVITRAIQNKVVLQYQASSLRDFLDGLIGPEGVSAEQRNDQLAVDALGLTGDITNDELVALLKALRVELRRFNDALDKAAVEPSALVKFRDTALKSAAVAFGATVGTGVAGLFVTSLGGLMDSAGLMEWQKFIEFIKAVRGGGG